MFFGRLCKKYHNFLYKKNPCTQVKIFDEKYVVTNRKLRSIRFKWHVNDSHENSLVYKVIHLKNWKVSFLTVLLSQLVYTRRSDHRKIWIKKNIPHSGTWINEFFFQELQKIAQSGWTGYTLNQNGSFQAPSTSKHQNGWS